MSAITNIQHKQMQMFLEKWHPYIEDDNFELLTELVTNTINGVKMDKLYVIYDKDDNKNGYLIKDLENFIQISYMTSSQTSSSYHHNPSIPNHEMIAQASSQLCIINSFEEVNNYENIKQVLSNEYIILRRLYQPAEQYKFNCNVLGITNKFPFSNDETITSQINIIRIKPDMI